jgi:beta-phosphoglucomutase-like phosphatase (HAD superfamily)
MDTALDPGVRVQALLVDLDGTLVDTTRAVESAWQRAAERLGVDLVLRVINDFTV